MTMRKKLFLILPIMLMAIIFTQLGSYEATTTHKTTNDINKIWTINFSQSIDPYTVDFSTVFITDQHGATVDTSLEVVAKNQVVISPNEWYKVGETYHLHITEAVMSKDRQPLKEKIVMPFTVAPLGEHILSIEAVLNPLVTNFVVYGHPSVSHVTVTLPTGETRDLHRSLDRFSRGLAGVFPGEKLTVHAYDTSGKMLETIDYVLK